MKMSINTEMEGIKELKHTITIIEEAIRRRENSNPILNEEKKTITEEYKSEAVQENPQEFKESAQQEKSEPARLEPEKPVMEAPKVEEPKPQIEMNLTKPTSYVQVQQMHQTEKPKPMSSRTDERGSAGDIDISALSTSSYGEMKEGRRMEGQGPGSSGSSSPSYSSSQSSSSSQPRGFEPRGMEPRGFEPRIINNNNNTSINNSKSVVKDIISSIRGQRPGQPIQVTDVVGRARNRNISEQETRNLISQLQREGSI